MPTPRRRTSSRQPDLRTEIRSVFQELIQEAEDRRNPQARRDRVLDRMEAFLDGFEQGHHEESGAGRRRGQRDRDDDDGEDDDDDEGGPNLLDLLAGGGRRR